MDDNTVIVLRGDRKQRWSLKEVDHWACALEGHTLSLALPSIFCLLAALRGASVSSNLHSAHPSTSPWHRNKEGNYHALTPLY